MSVLTYLIGTVAIGIGVFLWTVFTFLAIDQNDPRVWRLAPILAGVIAGLPVIVLSKWEAGLLVAVLVTALALVASTVLLDSFETVRRDYLEENS